MSTNNLETLKTVTRLLSLFAKALNEHLLEPNNARGAVEHQTLSDIIASSATMNALSAIVVEFLIEHAAIEKLTFEDVAALTIGFNDEALADLKQAADNELSIELLSFGLMTSPMSAHVPEYAQGFSPSAEIRVRLQPTGKELANIKHVVYLTFIRDEDEYFGPRCELSINEVNDQGLAAFFNVVFDPLNDAWHAHVAVAEDYSAQTTLYLNSDRAQQPQKE